MLAELLFGIKRVKLQSVYGMGLIEFDASISEQYTDEVEITDHPVEQGVDITDHVRQRPKIFEMTGVISQTPIYFLASLLAPSPVLTDFGPTMDRVGAAYQKLRELQDAAELVEVVTPFRTYESMVIQTISVPRDAARGNVMEVSLTFRELVFATAMSIDAAMKVPKAVGNAVAKNKGKVQKQEQSGPQYSDNTNFGGNINGFFTTGG